MMVVGFLPPSSMEKKLIEYIEYLNVPTKVALSIVALFLITQVVGELMEVQGKVVPEFVKIRKYFSRKKQEREILRQVPETLKGSSAVTQ